MNAWINSVSIVVRSARVSSSTWISSTMMTDGWRLVQLPGGASPVTGVVWCVGHRWEWRVLHALQTIISAVCNPLFMDRPGFAYGPSSALLPCWSCAKSRLNPAMRETERAPATTAAAPGQRQPLQPSFSLPLAGRAHGACTARFIIFWNARCAAAAAAAAGTLASIISSTLVCSGFVIARC